MWRAKPEKPYSNSLSSYSSQSLNAIVTLHNMRASVTLHRLKNKISPYLFLLFFFSSLSHLIRSGSPLSRLSPLDLTLSLPPPKPFLPQSQKPESLTNPFLLQSKKTHLTNPYFHHSLSISQTYFFLGHFKTHASTIDLERPLGRKSPKSSIEQTKEQ
jgi:hypothetical protein